MLEERSLAPFGHFAGQDFYGGNSTTGGGPVIVSSRWDTRSATYSRPRVGFDPPSTPGIGGPALTAHNFYVNVDFALASVRSPFSAKRRPALVPISQFSMATPMRLFRDRVYSGKKASSVRSFRNLNTKGYSASISSGRPPTIPHSSQSADSGTNRRSCNYLLYWMGNQSSGA